jgi:hypothetical protein
MGLLIGKKISLVKLPKNVFEEDWDDAKIDKECK